MQTRFVTDWCSFGSYSPDKNVTDMISFRFKNSPPTCTKSTYKLGKPCQCGLPYPQYVTPQNYACKHLRPENVWRVLWQPLWLCAPVGGCPLVVLEEVCIAWSHVDSPPLPILDVSEKLLELEVAVHT
eukprot:5274365-Amphidinium_carterae.1